MNRTAKEFFKEIVIPAYTAWKNSTSRIDEEWVFRAVTGYINDLVEYEANDLGIVAGRHRRSLTGAHRNLKIVADIANGTKHVRITHNNPIISDSSALQLDQAMIHWERLSDIKSLAGHAVPVANSDDGGEEINLEKTIDKAMEIWSNRIY